MKKIIKILLITGFSLLLIVLIIAQINNRKKFWQIRPAQEIFFNNSFFSSQKKIKQMFVLSDRENIQAIDVNSGKINWQFNAGSTIDSNIIDLEKQLFFMTEDQNLFSIDNKNGQLKWKKNFGLKKGQIREYGDNILLNQLDGKITLVSNKGKIIWETFIPVSKEKPLANYSSQYQLTIQNWSMKLIFGKTDIYIFFQNTANRIDGKTGELIWTKTLEKQITTQPIFINDLIVFSDQEGDIFGLNPQNGEVEWTKTTNPKTTGQITNISLFKTTITNFSTTILNKVSHLLLPHNLFLADFARYRLNLLIYNLLKIGTLIIDDQGVVSLLKQNDLEEIWRTETELKIPRLLEISKDYVLIANHEQILALNHDGSIAWKKDIPSINQYLKIEKSFFRKLLPFSKEIIVLTSFENKVSAINAKTGQTVWEFSNHSSTSSPLIELPKSLIVISDNGIIYRINKFKGTVAENIKINHEVNLKNLQNKDILKINFISKENYFKSPFYQVKIDCNFQSPGGLSHQQAGFYYDYNTWQVRFNPQENGQWQWQCAFIGPGIKKDFSGSFHSEKNLDEFIKLQSESRFLTLDGENLFYPLGLNQTMVDFNHNGDYFDDFYTGEEQGNQLVDLEKYLDVYYKESGFNTFRWNPGNHQFAIAANTRYPENDYSIAHSKSADYLLENLYQRDIQIYLTLFAWGLPGNSQYPQGEFAINHYIEYMVARYGAYTSVWELTNEGVLDDKTAIKFLDKLKTLQPDKPLSISWEKPHLEEVDIISPHWYSTSTPIIADTEILREIDKFKEYQKPIIFGEIGNGTKNWDEDSTLIMRVRAWTALFNGAGLIFWNSSYSKDFYNEAFENANQYIGVEERQYIKIISDFAKGLNSKLRKKSFMNNLKINDTRIYTLASEEELLAYAYHFANKEYETEFSFEIYLEQVGYLRWFNPKTGEVISEQKLNSGRHSLQSPFFKEDLVLKIRLDPDTIE
jgi:outer membrane protein assembly factor BamB